MMWCFSIDDIVAHSMLSYNGLSIEHLPKELHPFDEGVAQVAGLTCYMYAVPIYAHNCAVPTKDPMWVWRGTLMTSPILLTIELVGQVCWITPGSIMKILPLVTCMLAV